MCSIQSLSVLFRTIEFLPVLKGRKMPNRTNGIIRKHTKYSSSKPMIIPYIRITLIDRSISSVTGLSSIWKTSQGQIKSSTQWPSSQASRTKIWLVIDFRICSLFVSNNRVVANEKEAARWGLFYMGSVPVCDLCAFKPFRSILNSLSLIHSSGIFTCGAMRRIHGLLLNMRNDLTTEILTARHIHFSIKLNPICRRY